MATVNHFDFHFNAFYWNRKVRIEKNGVEPEETDEIKVEEEKT